MSQLNNSMHAMVLDEPGQALNMRCLPCPQPGPDQLLVKIAACAVCRTDLHVVDGELPKPKLPIIPGHEIVGRVVVLRNKYPQFFNWGTDWYSLAGLDLWSVPLLPQWP